MTDESLLEEIQKLERVIEQRERELDDARAEVAHLTDVVEGRVDD